jgi:hypothetical protein
MLAPILESASNAEANRVQGLGWLTSNVLEHVLSFLGAEQIRMLSRASRSLLRDCADDALWSALCVSTWGVGGEEALRAYGLTCFRSLYAVLDTFCPLQGMYTSLEDYPHGTAVNVRFERGALIGEELVPNKQGELGRFFSIRISQDTGSSEIKILSHCFRHDYRDAIPGIVTGIQAEIRQVPRPGHDIPASGVFAQTIACCSQLVLGPDKILEVVFDKGEDEKRDLAGQWFLPEEEEQDASVEVPSVPGERCQRLAEALMRGQSIHNLEETLAPVVTLWKVHTLLPCDANRHTMRAAGMLHWAVLPLPGIYIGDYGEQYRHRRNEVLLFEYVRGPRANESGAPIGGGGDGGAGGGGGVPMTPVGDAEGGEGEGGEGLECWWLVVTKCWCADFGEFHISCYIFHIFHISCFMFYIFSIFHVSYFVFHTSYHI